ncbi:MAG: hypothetical protein IJQ79_11465 [Bacteroidales bacterium]|nr:hypothetical protein [Bacteroidales bacterium]
MKHLIKFLLPAGLALAGLISCEKDVPAGEKAGPVPAADKVAKEFTASFAGSKATLAAFPEVRWQQGDDISVWDGSDRNIFSIKPGTNQGSTATFEGFVAEDATAPFPALFPASSFISCDGTSFTAAVPATQSIVPGSPNAAGATVAVGQVGSDGKLSLKNVIGLVKFTIGDNFDGQINTVILSGAGSEPVAGQVVIDSATGEITSVKSASTSITLTAGSSASLPAGDYYIAVLPVAFSQGFSLSFKNLSGKSIEKSTSNAMSIPRGGGKDLGTVTAGLKEFSSEIMTADELVGWNENCQFAEGEVYKLGADIDMEGKPWTPRSDFVGTFDGQGHKIYNFVVSTNEYTGFIRTTKDGGTACIKNLIIGSKDGKTWDGVSKIVHTSSANNYTWYYAGVVAKTMGQTDLTDIINFAAVEIEAGSTGKTRAAGICGNVASTGTIKGCINYGSVTNNASVTGVSSNGSTTLQPSALGGIAAQTDKDVTYDHCINYGTITNRNPGVFRIGGILGNTSYAYLITDCENYGNIVLEETCSSENSYIGGILGYGKGTNLKNCTNHADFNWNTFNATTFAGGVFAYVASSSVEGCVNEGSLTVGKGGKYANWCSFGGVAASIYTSAVMKDCKNLGAVDVYFEQTVRVGGVCGTLNSSCTLSNSINSAPVRAELNVENNRWAAVGGVCAFQEKGSGNAVTGCSNSGKVSLEGDFRPTSGSVHGNGGNAGGILGFGCLSLNIKDNVNTGEVFASNSSTPPFYAGGIVGHLITGSGITTYGNTNEAPVSASTSDGTAACAGGVLGCASVSSFTASADRNYGAVSCSNASNAGSVAGVNAGTLTGCGAGGSVCGTVLDSSNFSGFVQGGASTGSHSGSTFISK